VPTDCLQFQGNIQAQQKTRQTFKTAVGFLWNFENAKGEIIPEGEKNRLYAGEASRLPLSISSLAQKAPKYATYFHFNYLQSKNNVIQ
jgi:hypothetical protein